MRDEEQVGDGQKPSADGAAHGSSSSARPGPISGVLAGGPDGDGRADGDGWHDGAGWRAQVQIRDDLLAVVSHDMNNALNSIRLAAALLGRGAILRQDRDAARATDTIARIVQRLHLLTRDLTDFALLEGGRLSIAIAPFEPGQVIEDVAAELLPVAAEKGVSIVVDRLEAVMFGRGDRARLLQVISNLGGNAIKFAPPGTTVTIGAGIDGADFRFFVSDEGPGIPASLRESVFRAGVRAAPASGGGAGLGLAIAKTVVELMGGTIRVDPVEPRGACFSFTIPRIASEG